MQAESSATRSRDKDLLRPIHESINRPLLLHSGLKIKMVYYERVTLDSRTAEMRCGPKIISISCGKPIQLRHGLLGDFAVVDRLFRVEGDVRDPAPHITQVPDW